MEEIEQEQLNLFDADKIEYSLRVEDEEITWSNDQKEQLEKIKFFLKNKAKDLKAEDRIYTLSGKGGTGKTTLLSAITLFATQELRKEVTGFCITSQAVKILRKSINQSCYTLAADLGLRPAIDPRTRETTFIKIKRSYVSNAEREFQSSDLIIIDECSMISYKLYKQITEVLNNHPSKRIIFVGDHHQLPPVEKVKKGFVSSTFKTKKVGVLKENMRSKDTPVTDLGDELADMIDEALDKKKSITKKNVEKFVQDINAIPTYIRVLDGSVKGTRGKLVREYSRNLHDTKLICYRNKMIDKYNNLVRKALYKKKADEYELLSGDRILANASYYGENTPYWSSIGNKWQTSSKTDALIESAEEKIVESVEPGELSFPWKFIHDQPVYIMAEDKAPYIIPVHCIYLEGVKHPVYAVTKDGKKEYKKVYSLLLKLCSADHNWQRYFAYTGSFLNWSYGYCVTAYKAQGMTVPNIIVDAADILATAPLTAIEQLNSLYTAVSRASKTVTLIK